MISLLIILFARLLGFAAGLWTILIFIRVIMSWFNPYGQGQLFVLVFMLTEPVLKPIRIVVNIGAAGLDLAPILAIIILSLISRYLIPYLLLLAERF